MSAEKKLFPTYSIYAPADLSKRWFVYYYEGKKRVRVYGDINHHKTKEARQAAADALLAELKAKRKVKITTLELDVRLYIRQNEHRWRQKTREQYDTIANKLFSFLGGRKLDEVLLDAFFLQVQQTRHPTTYNRYLVMCKALLAGAGYAHITTSFDTIRSEKTPARYFQRFQAKRLMALMEEVDPDLAMYVRYMYFCFLRPNEINQLRVGDILLEEQEVRITSKVSKNKKSQYIAIPQAFVPELAGLYDRAPGEYLFPSPMDRTKQIGRDTMSKRHKKLLEQLNFGEGYSIYSWRHTGAVMVAKAGKVSMKELQIQFRHHSLDQTDAYLRQLGVKDLGRFRAAHVAVW